MSRRVLTKTTVRRFKGEPGKNIRKSCGNGLIIVSQNAGLPHWYVRYRLEGKDKMDGLGRAKLDPAARGAGITWDEAHEMAQAVRNDLKQGVTPAERRRLNRAAEKAREKETFRAVFEHWWTSKQGDWTNTKYRDDDIRQSFDVWILPAIGDKVVNEIEPRDLIDVSNAMFNSGAVERSGRLIGRIQAVLRYAAEVDGLEPRYLSLRRGLVERTLAGSHRKKTTQAHHAALSPEEFPEFLKALDAVENDTVIRSTVVRLALEIQIRLALRSGEVRLGKWSEIDWGDEGQGAVWNIPGSRMKTRIDFRVPLPRQVVGLFEELFMMTGPDSGGDYADDGWMFPVQKRRVASNTGPDGLSDVTARDEAKASSRPPVIAENTLNYAIGRLNREVGPDGAAPKWGAFHKRHTSHGNRSVFSTWGHETGKYAYEVVEKCLAHKLEDDVAARYMRGDYLELRRRLMQDWNDWIDQKRFGGNEAGQGTGGSTDGDDTGMGGASPAGRDGVIDFATRRKWGRG